jgi:hypothetical protein
VLEATPNALVHLQAHHHHCGEAASEKCLSAATFVMPAGPQLRLLSYPRLEDADLGGGSRVQCVNERSQVQLELLCVEIRFHLRCPVEARSMSVVRLTASS